MVTLADDVIADLDELKKAYAKEHRMQPKDVSYSLVIRNLIKDAVARAEEDAEDESEADES